ncbi:MAG: translation initiation factor IF-3 [Planctomycetaceae bacterium]
MSRFPIWKRHSTAGGFQRGIAGCFYARQEASTIDHRINDQIRISPIRLVDSDGNMIGEIPTADAQQMAIESGLDLVEVAANVRPPVCRIMNYGKFKYEQQKKKKESAKHHQVQLKEIRLRPKTGEHDIQFKIKRARSFLEHRNKVKINILFRGRENAHHDRGREILDGIIGQLEDIAKVEKTPSMDGGRMMSTILAPL